MTMLYRLVIAEEGSQHDGYGSARAALDTYARSNDLTVDAQEWTKRGADLIGARGVLREDNAGELLAVTDWVIQPAPPSSPVSVCERFEQDYRPLMDALSARFGAVFAMENTGGGCMAITARLDGYTLFITDAAETLSPLGDRRDPANQDNPHVGGFAVGVYGMEFDAQCGWYVSADPVGWASDPGAETADELGQLIASALGRVGGAA
jgi:hypothetical protein